MITVDDGRSYIGVSNVPRARFRTHCRADTRIGEAIRACDRDRVVQRLLVCGPRDYIFDLEYKAVSAFRTRWPVGFNVASGGHGGRDQLPCHRAKIGASHKGKRLSPEHRAKLSAAKKKPDAIARLVARNKRGPSEDTRRRLIASHLGHKHSDETRAKMAAAHRGKPKVLSPQARANIIASNKRRAKRTYEDAAMCLG